MVQWQLYLAVFIPANHTTWMMVTDSAKNSWVSLTFWDHSCNRWCVKPGKAGFLRWLQNSREPRQWRFQFGLLCIIICIILRWRVPYLILPFFHNTEETRFLFSRPDLFSIMTAHTSSLFLATITCSFHFLSKPPSFRVFSISQQLYIRTVSHIHAAG